MPWLFLLVALAAFVVAFKASSVALAFLCLLVALGAMVAWVMGLFANRVGSRSRDESLMLNPDELRRMREQAEARRVAAAQTPEPPVS
ncbi:MAG: hypothetical protein ABIO38_08830 [Luteimonas sp.]